MNSESFSENNQSAEQPPNPIGPRLKRAREELRLTITDIARQLRLTEERIESLENDDYQNMPGTTFVKGYLRAYARLVNLPADKLILDFERLNLMPENKSFILSSYKQPVLLNNKSLRWVIYLIGIGLLILAATWWSSSTSTDPANLNSSEAKHPPTKNMPVTGALTNHTMPTVSSANVAGNPNNSASTSQPAKNPAQAEAANAAMLHNQQGATPAPATSQSSSALPPTGPSSTPSVSPESSNKQTATAGVGEATTDGDSDNNNDTQPRKKNPARSHSRPQLEEPFENE